MARLVVSASGFESLVDATREEVRQAVIATAKAENEKIQRTDPIPARTLRYVDGRAGAPEEAVRHDGVIVYDYPRIDLVAQFALETLRAKSPFRTGTYQESHQLFLNDEPVANLRAWQPGARVMIANSVPYARKIEIGAMKMKVPGTDHVYQQSSVIVRRQYGEIASVRFTYVGLEGVEFDAGRRGGGNLLEPGFIVPGRRGNQSSLRYPALLLSEL